MQRRDSRAGSRARALRKRSLHGGAESVHQRPQALGLHALGLRRGGGLLDERCVLLGTAIHLGDRAASTAAFSARMSVWNAMPSMTAMICSMRHALSSILPIVATARCTVSPTACTCCADSPANFAASAACAWFCLTVPDNASVDAAVCCRLEA